MGKRKTVQPIASSGHGADREIDRATLTPHDLAARLVAVAGQDASRVGVAIRVRGVDLKLEIERNGAQPQLDLSPPELEDSGIAWCGRFPGSNSISDLTPTFKKNVEGFVSALEAGGVRVDIESTFRPIQRQYLMHYSFRISEPDETRRLSAQAVPTMDGVRIRWAHATQNGGFDEVASILSAREMVKEFHIVHLPARNSNHCRGEAIDMEISWVGTVSIKRANGQVVQIFDTPRDNQNVAIHEIAASYGVLKNLSDSPHWSIDGR